jgi:hypothetical protein
MLTRFRRGGGRDETRREKKERKNKARWKRKTEEERKEKKRKDGSSRRVPDALSGFVCDLHSQSRIPPSFYSTSLTLTPFPWNTIA